MFDRLLNVIGKDNYELLRSKKILLVGIGGVGGYALECLVRSGIEQITIADFDTIEITNLNRQIISTQHNINCLKVDEAKKRAESINSNIDIKIYAEKLTSVNIEDFLSDNYDYIIDACDDVSLKCEMIKIASKRRLNIISCMGTGNRLHPENCQISKLKNTQNDPLAKKMRYILGKEDKKYLETFVVWSSEIPKRVEKLGTVCPVPMAAGSILAGFVINSIIKEQN